MEKTESGLYVPQAALPAGYAKFDADAEHGGWPVAIAVAFITAVTASPCGKVCHIYTTTSEEPFAVAGSLEAVTGKIREAQQ